MAVVPGRVKGEIGGLTNCPTIGQQPLMPWLHGWANYSVRLRPSNDVIISAGKLPPWKPMSRGSSLHLREPTVYGSKLAKAYWWTYFSRKLENAKICMWVNETREFCRLKNKCWNFVIKLIWQRRNSPESLHLQLQACQTMDDGYITGESFERERFVWSWTG